jgi:putative toxin-antitoxin system antitoxin component (TIGR02293 family)
MINAKIENTTEHYKRVVKVLGEENIKGKIESPFDYINIASNGISASVINNFSSFFNMNREITALLFDVSSPTIYRWTKAGKLLSRNFAVKLFEMTDLFLYGSDIFESKENFNKWLNLPNTALGGMEPIELLEIPGGISKVKDIIGRIEHGVYS